MDHVQIVMEDHQPVLDSYFWLLPRDILRLYTKRNSDYYT